MNTDDDEIILNMTSDKLSLEINDPHEIKVFLEILERGLNHYGSKIKKEADRNRWQDALNKVKI